MHMAVLTDSLYRLYSKSSLTLKFECYSSEVRSSGTGV